FHLINKIRYLWNRSVSSSISSRRRMLRAPSENRSRAVFMPSGEGTLGSCRVLRLTGRATGTGPVHVPLLKDLKDVRNGPIQYEPRREIEKHEREDEGHH